VVFEIVQDGADKFWDTPEDTSPQATLCQVSEEALYEVQPRATGRDEVEVEAWMALEPSPHLGVLVGRVVVEDQVKVDIGRGLGVDEIEELDPLLMPVAGHAESDRDNRWGAVRGF
jgi:hypothetical protein